MSRYKVLIDSSAWIQYFNVGDVPVIDRLLEEDFACTNDLILTELQPVLAHRQRYDVLEGLLALERIPLLIDWEAIRKYQLMNFQNGINKVGIPDLIILQQVIEEKITLFSFDKHFKLMGKYLNFDLISTTA
ncbi:PIN domain-containing protein [Sphingobacterium sp. DN00404]|uniref:PIN domain-containing protein n=1 Tax=Sphingobacterium micropteri TaxID=2763501 RepID=A0ABR7YS62_9SPHI|nr:PIN domain-containing protein [Sphingobacterium micropteri]MBD1434155.1 PIN domain-containing protein [Sphingobacterium micropteri]